MRRTREQRRPKKEKRKISSGIHLSGDEMTANGLSVRRIQQTIDAIGNLFWKSPVGNTEIRILPPTAVFEGDMCIRQVVHYGFEDKRGSKRCVACLREHDEDCPLCEFVEELNATGEKNDKKIAHDCRAGLQLICEVIVRPSKRVRIWTMPVSIYRVLASAAASARIGDFTHSKTGRDVLITRVGTGKFDTKYSAQLLDVSKIGVKGWKRRRIDLSGILAPVLSAKKLRGLIKRTYGE